MNDLASLFDGVNPLGQVAVPDLWQQQAVSALREGKDVVVQAPTGAGKTLVFELWSNQGKPRGQAIYTVPTRALANDKLAEWRARGWQVGIATGDLSENLEAPVIVATLETQKHRLIRGEGPTLLVVDEYQMIGDPDRGLSYEVAIAMAPPRTQLLLLSGSVANPHDVVKWLRRLGREAVLVKHEIRPVPLDEVHAENLSYHVPSQIHGYWPRLVANALAEDLGPVLLFAPRRQASETMAADLARQIPCPNPLQLSPAQRQLVGDNLARMLKSRVAYHHSGLSYAIRAGLIEPLAKAGQLRIVVATMGLAAGINFSLRSVALAGESYRREAAEQPLRPDEILQMFGRAGRRGLDETGYVIVSANGIRLLDAHPGQLSRSGMVDWGALLSVMHVAARSDQDPFNAAVRLQERLFTSKPIFLGVEESLKQPAVPCGLHTDSERARLVRKRVRQMRDSRGQWQDYPVFQEKPVREIFADAETARHTPTAADAMPDAAPILVPLLAVAPAMEKLSLGVLCPVGEQDGRKLLGKAQHVADRLHDGRVVMTKWVRRLTGWNGREAPMEIWEQKIAPLLARRLAEQNKTPVVRFTSQGSRLFAEVSLAGQIIRVPVDQHGVPLWKPREREVLPPACAGCDQIETCRKLPTATGTALLWRRLGLMDPAGRPTRRGQLTSFFHQSDGLAIAVALEEERYPLDELVYDVANLDAGFRFAGDENRFSGRLAMVCHEKFGIQTIPGYLENGLPPKYGAGAEQVVAAVHRDPLAKYRWVTPVLGVGDMDRMIIEWRSLLRQISHAPELEWPRWKALQAMAKGILHETESPTLTELPPLEFHQTRRVEHRLQLRRH